MLLKLHSPPSPPRKAFALVAAGVMLLCSPLYSEAQVQITQVNDFTLGTWNGSSDVVSPDDICVYNAGSSDYQIAIEGGGPGGSYLLTNGGHTLAYQIEFRGGGGWVTLSPGVAQTFTGADSASVTCNGGTNASIRVTVSQANMLAANRGSYTGPVTLVVSP